MWPVHCVQESFGSQIHKDLVVKETDVTVKKGMLERVDSYSGFGSAPEVTTLNQVLKENQISRVYSVGLAFDYCVGSTAIDAVKNGYESYLIRDAAKSVAKKSELIMGERLKAAGVQVIESLTVF